MLVTASKCSVAFQNVIRAHIFIFLICSVVATEAGDILKMTLVTRRQEVAAKRFATLYEHKITHPNAQLPLLILIPNKSHTFVPVLK